MIMRHRPNAKLRRIILPANYFTRDSSSNLQPYSVPMRLSLYRQDESLTCLLCILVRLFLRLGCRGAADGQTGVWVAKKVKQWHLRRVPGTPRFVSKKVPRFVHLFIRTWRPSNAPWAFLRLRKEKNFNHKDSVSNPAAVRVIFSNVSVIYTLDRG